eukprot:TRINITY_DN4706_c0_g1_i1.p1 TRINITY_DN4706_c0_g1~~TRINITY_DN4706_c0_g1_i1.p1  ORF type:complete len:1149 (-),score=298.23 TRINITY_DN4706_c0_g1_i1:138-3584(-)
MEDFLGEQNLCGQTILRLVSRGSAIIAELLRLGDNIPQLFMPETKSDYSPVISDFAYLNREDEFEKRIQASQKMLELDEDLRDNYMPTLSRFFVIFEALYKYIKDFLKFLSDVEDGVFIQQTYETILMHPDGKQLMAEALYLYGVMLLLLDMKIDGAIRERMLISYLRYKGAGEIDNIDEVCKLCRSTGYSARYGKTPGVHPPGYPEEYFARIPVPQKVVNMITGRLRTDDIYQMGLYYPSPDHRSTALSTQAAMLYVLLYFQSDVLKNNQPVMREIVDKHFPDNWIINWHMGFFVDLSVVWAPYKAANKAITNILTPENIQTQVTLHSTKVREMNNEVRELLREGLLTEDYVLDNINSKLLTVMRECNASLRWLILHRTTTNKKVREVIGTGASGEDILRLLLATAQLEFTLKEMFHMLLKQKKNKWTGAKDEGVAKMSAISEYFAGEQVLSSEKKEEQLQQWFAQTADNIEELSYQDSTLAGRKIQTLISALDDVEQFHQVFDNLQVRQYLMDTRTLLRKMLRYVNIKEEVAISIATVGDVRYAWELIATFVEPMQQRIKRSPWVVIQLRATFLKLTTMLELPLTRIAQANSPDLPSVSQYYSEVLVAFVRKVLDVIPVSMFQVLQHVIQIQSSKLKELPPKIPRAALMEFHQPEARAELARVTFQISNFTEGILAMEKTLMGVIQIDPHKLLEDGIRKELVQQISAVLHNYLVFGRKGDKETFAEKLAKLGLRLNAMKTSFEYIQDYVCVYGLRIWQEEFSRIINFNVEQESNQFVKKQVLEWDSHYQSEAIRIPKFPREPGDPSVNFMGRVLRELQNQIDPRRTTYVDQLTSWYEGGKEIVGLRTFTQLRESMSVFGLNGLDKLLCFMIVTDLQQLVKGIDKQILPGINKELELVARELGPPDCLPRGARRLYEGPMMQKLMKNGFPQILTYVMRVGSNQLLRRHISNELKFVCKLDSNTLYNVLGTFNESLLADVQAHYREPDEYPYPERDNPLFPELSNYLDAAGLTHPFSKVYITVPSIPFIPILLVLFVISQLDRFVYQRGIDSLVCKKKEEPLDGIPFVVGIVTILKQLHSEHKNMFIAYLAQYVRVMLKDMTEKEKEKDREVIPVEVENCLYFLEAFCKAAPLPRKVVENQIPVMGRL